MSRDVQLQADIGSLGLQGLGAFTSILATLSADNVSPMALIQLEQLGSNFPVNGKLAEDVKGLLQRCKDKRLDHFAFAMGWRKNDSASLMAQSAGGQAIALLSACLSNLYADDNTGIILARLCSKLCPRAVNVSSVVQLADVAKLLAGKANALGFGNLLAREAARIYDAYCALGRPLPTTRFLDDLSVDSMEELLEKASQALCQENKICRITGYRSMGHIIGLLQALFPYNLVLTVEGVVIQDVEHPKIRCEVDVSAWDESTQLHLETIISNSTSIQLPIGRLTNLSHYTGPYATYTFNWSNWLADYLRLIFMEYGLMCDGNIIQACCNLLVLVPASIYVEATVPQPHDRDRTSVPLQKLLDLLGPLPRARMGLICDHIMGCNPAVNSMDLPTAFASLVAMITETSPIDLHMSRRPV